MRIGWLLRGVAVAWLFVATLGVRVVGVETSSLAARLTASGRAVVRFERRASDPFEGRLVSDPGLLVLELGLADVRFDRTGERLTVRPDGGEWLQPQLRQMVTMGPETTVAAKHWWNVLLSGGASKTRIVAEGKGRYLVLGPEREGARDTARVQLDRDGLPSRLEVVDSTGRSEFHFGRWRFDKARGRGSFVQRAPRGVERVPLK